MISPSRLDAFLADGYVAINDVLGENDLALAEEPIAAWINRQIRDWGRPAAQNYKAEFLDIWRSAGSPQFRRSPTTNLVRREFYMFLRSRAMLELASSLLQTDEISVHGIWNARPMMPGAPVTPWHQDAQYWRMHGEPDPSLARTRRVLTVWIPLQDLDTEIGGLEVASVQASQRRLFGDDLKDAVTSYLTVESEVTDAIAGETPLLRRGGCLCFSQLNLHRGTPNASDRIRWSLDVRYEATEGATLAGRRFGFVASSPSGRFPEDTFENWQERCAASLAAGS